MKKGDMVRVRPDVASAYFHPVRGFAERLKPAKVLTVFADKVQIEFEMIFHPEKYRYLVQIADLEHVP